MSSLSEKEIIKKVQKYIYGKTADGLKSTEAIKELIKLEEKYKLALFMVIRNSKILPIGEKLKKTDYEINKKSYQTMREVLKMIDFERAEEMYKEGASDEQIK